MRFPHFLFCFPQVTPKGYKNIAGMFFSRLIFCAAYAACTCLEIPAVYFRFHSLTAEACTPVIYIIGLNSFKGVNVGICRSQNEVTVDTGLVFPVLSVCIDTVGDDIGYSGAGCASSPVTCFVCMVDILMVGSAGTAETAGVTDFVTIGSIIVLVDICLLLASGADLPVLIVIIMLFAVGFMTGLHYISTIGTGFKASTVKLVFLVSDTAATVCAACPVIDAVVLPVLA